MILVDANILLYAEDRSSKLHREAKGWWDSQLSSDLPVCLPWMILLAFLRIATNRRAFQTPLNLSAAVHRVQSWLNQPCVRIIEPTSRHWDILSRLLKEGQAVANLVSDAHLAALAIEHGCTLFSTDADFSRFPKLKWKNPLKGAR